MVRRLYWETLPSLADLVLLILLSLSTQVRSVVKGDIRILKFILKEIGFFIKKIRENVQFSNIGEWTKETEINLPGLFFF